MRSKEGKEEFWCKQPIALFGMSSEDCAGLSPFDPKFHDPYVEGRGSTREEALINLEKDMSRTADMIWA